MTTLQSTLPAPPPLPPALPTGTYRPIGRLAGWVEGITVTGIVASLTLAVAAMSGVEVRGDFVLTPDAVQALLIAEVVLVVALRIATHLWTYRLTTNAAALGAAGLDHTPASSIWWWYVPIASLFKPPKILNDLAKASDPGYEAGTSRWTGLAPQGLVGAWWGAYLALAFGGQVALGVGLESTAARPALTVVALAMAVALGLWWAVVRRITALHRHRATRLARAGRIPEAFCEHGRT